MDLGGLLKFCTWLWEFFPKDAWIKMVNQEMFVGLEKHFFSRSLLNY